MARVTRIVPKSGSTFHRDCLKSIDEIGHLGREQFRSSGGDRLHLVECVNNRTDWLDAMLAIARREVAGEIQHVVVSAGNSAAQRARTAGG